MGNRAAIPSRKVGLRMKGGARAHLELPEVSSQSTDHPARKIMLSLSGFSQILGINEI
jgi:hypothetical protein